MSKLKLIIFDIDGTIVDTSEYVYAAYEHVLSQHGFPARTREDIASQIGRKIEECYAFLAPGSHFPTMKSSHDDFQTANVSLVRPFEYANEILQEIHDAPFKLALWTGRNHYVVETLEHAGIDTSLFEMIITPDQTENGKPDPEGIHLIAETLGIEPEAVAVVGDADLEIIAGKRAGVRATIGITHGFGTRESLEAATPTHIIDSLSELPQILTKL